MAAAIVIVAKLVPTSRYPILHCGKYEKRFHDHCGTGKNVKAV
jgi:hypothetical protein